LMPLPDRALTLPTEAVLNAALINVSKKMIPGNRINLFRQGAIATGISC